MRTVSEHARTRFTCATCKRVRAKSQRELGRNRCRDRANCLEAAGEWLSRERFARGASAR